MLHTNKIVVISFIALALLCLGIYYQDNIISVIQQPILKESISIEIIPATVIEGVDNIKNYNK